MARALLANLARFHFQEPARLFSFRASLLRTIFTARVFQFYSNAQPILAFKLMQIWSNLGMDSKVQIASSF